jgi:hypothetical protein
LIFIALTTLVFLAVWTERRRDPEEIDGKIRARYLANMKDSQAKNDVMFSQIRGQNTKLDSSMNNLVWGGKAKIVPPNNQNPTPSAGSGSSSSSDEEEDSDSETEADLEDDSMLGEAAASLEDLPGDSAETKRQKRKERKRRKKEKRRKRRELKRQKKEKEVVAALIVKRQEQIKQAGIAAAAVGVVAVAASVLMGGSRRG